MKNTVREIFLTSMVMLGLPWLAVTFFKGDGGMAVCFLLFFAIDPVYAGVTGFLAGRGKMARFQPVLTSLLFLLGVWLLFDMGEPAFMLYAAGYLLLGYAAMLLSWLLQRKK